MPYIFVVIPTYNRKNHLEKLLHQLNKQKNEKFQLDIVIVIDGSTDGTDIMLKKKFPGVLFVYGTGNWWFTKSLNEGFKYAKQFNPDFVLILNDDTETKPDYIENLITEYKKINKEAILGSISLSKTAPHKITYAGTKKMVWWRSKRYSYPLNPEQDISLLDSLHPSQTLTARGTLIPFSILENLNYFDEKKFPQYGSDEDFALKANRYGIPVYISYKCQLFDNTEITNKAAPRLAPKFFKFLPELFNKYSPVYLSNNIRLAWRYGKFFTFPISVFFAILGVFYRYIKYKFSTNKIY